LFHFFEMENRPVIDSVDSDDENTPVAATQKRKEPPTEIQAGTIEPMKKRKVPGLPSDSCYNCNETGHLSRDCTKPRPFESGCMTCHSKAHSTKYCPKRIEALEQDRATLLQLQYSGSYGGGSGAPTTAYPSVDPGPHAYTAQPQYATTASSHPSYPTTPQQQQQQQQYPQIYGNYAASPYPGYTFDPVTQQYVLDSPCLKCGMPGHKERDCTYGKPVSTLTRCFNCNSKGHLAKDCKKGAQPISCYNCGQSGHIGKECPTAGTRACFICKGNGHVAQQCPQLPVRVCYNCNETGHIGKNCPRSSTRQICYKCQQTGHKAVECPNPQVPRESGYAAATKYY
jgi:cellular nucleic acid-binding protein